MASFGPKRVGSGGTSSKTAAKSKPDQPGRLAKPSDKLNPKTIDPASVTFVTFICQCLLGVLRFFFLH